MSSEGLHVPREPLSRETFELQSVREEAEHAAMVLEWVRRNDAAFDKEPREYLFQKGSITGCEHVAEGKGQP